MAQSTTSSLRAALHYFDSFDYALTWQELAWYAWQWPAASEGVARLSDVARVLDGLGGQVEMREDLWCLAGRDTCINQRKERYIIAHRKYRKAVRATWWLARFPFVRMVAVCNDLAISAAPDESDIDIFVVAAAGHIWMARLWVCLGVLCGVLGARPKVNNRRDTLCFSFFASDDALDFSGLALPLVDGVPDVYLIYWIALLMPLYDAGGVYDRFYDENIWVAEYVPGRPRQTGHPGRRIVLGGGIQYCKAGCEWVTASAWLERAARWIQLKIMPVSLRERANADSCVVMSERYLKFHTNDRRALYRERWEKACQMYD